MTTSSPENIFSRLESLKKWQEEQQNRLRKQQNDQQEFLSKEQRRVCDALEIARPQQQRTHPDSPQTSIHGISVLDSSDGEPEATTQSSPQNVEDMPIKSPHKNFSQLLEEKLQQEKSSRVNVDPSRPKRAFLKKGAGLQRFKITTNITKPKPMKNVKKQAARAKSPMKTPSRDVGRVKECTPPPSSDFKIRKPILKQSKGPAQRAESARASRDLEYQAILREISMMRQQNATVDESAGQKAFEKALEQEIRRKKDQEELRAFEILEQKATNSSFCSTSSLVTKLMEKSVQRSPAPATFQELLRVPQSVSHVTFQTEDSDSSVNSEDISDSPRATLQETVGDFQDESAWSDDSATTDCSQADTSTAVRRNARDAATNTEQTYDGGQTELLQSRLEQLEKEIRVFREENAKTEALKRQLEDDHRDFERRKAKLLNELEAEHSEAQLQMEEERKALRRDRLVYEKHLKESRNRPTRKEREEIGLLQTQLANVREELKAKEARFGAAQARNRTHVKNLEKEVAALREENETLRKQNGKLEAARKLVRKPSETKMLHEINRNLSKLAQEAKVLPKTPKKRNPPTEPSSDSDDKTYDALQPKEHTYFDHHPKAKRSSGNKENDSNSPNVEDLSDLSMRFEQTFQTIERDYEKMFGAHAELPTANATSIDDSYKKDREERDLPDGSKQISYSNGNVKTVSPDGLKITMKYYNGDLKETSLENGGTRYFYAETGTWHTTHADGNEHLEFANGQTEKRYKDGRTEIFYPDGSQRFVASDGTEEIRFADGTVVVSNTDGEKVLTLPNGQKEIHTHDHKRREYPDGTVKLLYADGVQETRYANGRIRLKDPAGNLIMDSAHL